jgi:hypothetical protein
MIKRVYVSESYKQGKKEGNERKNPGLTAVSFHQYIGLPSCRAIAEKIISLIISCCRIYGSSSEPGNREGNCLRHITCYLYEDLCITDYYKYSTLETYYPHLLQTIPSRDQLKVNFAETAPVYPEGLDGTGKSASLNQM